MKNLKIISVGIIILILSSCATAVNFPISDLVPAANISVTKEKDNNGNYQIKVIAENLASPDRLNPSRNYYVVWGVTEDKEIKSIGLLSNKNAKKVELETVTPFDVGEVFITAEKEGDILQPSKMEITRKKL